MKKTLMFVVNVDWFFISHRLPIALEAIRQGYEVHIVTGITDQKETLEKYGLIVHSLTIDRSSANFFGTLRTFWQIVAVFRNVRPHLVHLVTIKPVLLGGIAARLVGVRSVVVAVSGLGYVFLDRGWMSRLRRIVVGCLYRLALGHGNIRVIFQNPDDRDSLIRLAKLPSGKVEMIRGSGVDLNVFRYRPLPEGLPIVVVAARLIADKGVREFVEAARMLHKKGSNVRCCIVGTPDLANPSSLSETELRAWEEEGVIERWGHRHDMENVLSAAHIVVLPSYREGVPKVLLEAAAVGRAVITTDVPGCRDAIEPWVTGVLVPVRNISALADAIDSLINDVDRCQSMGQAGRGLAEREFDVKQVVAKHMRIYQQLMEASR